jgi:hypothetical protein
MANILAPGRRAVPPHFPRAPEDPLLVAAGRRIVAVAAPLNFGSLMTALPLLCG